MGVHEGYMTNQISEATPTIILSPITILGLFVLIVIIYIVLRKRPILIVNG